MDWLDVLFIIQIRAFVQDDKYYLCQKITWLKKYEPKYKLVNLLFTHSIIYLFNAEQMDKKPTFPCHLIKRYVILANQTHECQNKYLKREAPKASAKDIRSSI